MSYTRFIHNVSGGEKTYRGVPIADDAYYEIEPANLVWYQTSSTIMTDLTADDIRMSADGASDYSTDSAKNIAFLLGSTPGPVDVTGLMDANKFRARLRGIGAGTVTKNTTKNFDHKFVTLSYNSVDKVTYYDGLQYYASNATVGDYVKLQVVDVDGIVYPAGTVLEEYVDTWYISPDKMETIRLFKSKITTGFYIRVAYTSISTLLDVDFMCNMFRFLKEDEDV